MSGSGMARGEEGRDAGRAQHVSNKLSGEAEQVVQARDIHATYFVVSGGSAAVGGSLNPQTLPTGPYSFTDRTELLSRLNSVATREREPGQPGIVLLRGMNGTGKTATSVHWAHSVRHRFPDGQLYVDLGGLDRRDLVDPCDVLGRFLCLLGVPAQEQPARLGDRSALFRTLTADSRLLMVLDNAPLTSAVTELLPTSRHSMVLVTSPRKLTGLSGEYGAESETLTPLTEEAGVELLGKLLGEGRVAGERDAAATLVRLCGGLPVAIRVVGGRLQKREQWRLARLVKELSDERRRLRGLSREEELPVQAACDVAYEDLPPDAARLYRLLSLHPGPDAAATPVARLC